MTPKTFCLLLNSLITKRILLLSPPDRVGACGVGAVHILQKVYVKQMENLYVPEPVFCCRKSGRHF